MFCRTYSTNLIYFRLDDIGGSRLKSSDRKHHGRGAPRNRKQVEAPLHGDLFNNEIDNYGFLLFCMLSLEVLALFVLRFYDMRFEHFFYNRYLYIYCLVPNY